MPLERRKTGLLDTSHSRIPSTVRRARAQFGSTPGVKHPKACRKQEVRKTFFGFSKPSVRDGLRPGTNEEIFCEKRAFRFLFFVFFKELQRQPTLSEHICEKNEKL